MELGILPFDVVVLWSDALLGVLLLGVFGLAVYLRGTPQAAAWGKVLANPLGMASATVLAAFLLIGVLDSLHYRPLLAKPPAQGDPYATEVKSVLDGLLDPLRTRTEKTYAAPLATHLFAKETFEIDGVSQRDFPRLKYGGAHLGNPQDAAMDIEQRASEGLLVAGLGWVLVNVAVSLWVARVQRVSVVTALGLIWRARTAVHWRSMLLTLLGLLAIVGPLVALAGYYPALGTDKVGQDVLYLSLKSVRTALLIGTLTTLVMLPLAMALGILAGFVGGWVDDVIQYLYTVLNSIPGVLLIAAAVLMMQGVIDQYADYFSTAAQRADARLLALCVILGLTSWTGLCRLLRGETLKLRELEYVQAARAFGVSSVRIMARHVAPNLMHIVLISVVMDFSSLVLAEAVLSYIGIGVDPNTVSFGTMINAARLELSREPMVWWSLASAFSFMFVLVLCANIFSDCVRDAFDPRLARR